LSHASASSKWSSRKRRAVIFFDRAGYVWGELLFFRHVVVSAPVKVQPAHLLSSQATSQFHGDSDNNQGNFQFSDQSGKYLCKVKVASFSLNPVIKQKPAPTRLGLSCL